MRENGVFYFAIYSHLFLFLPSSLGLHFFNFFLALSQSGCSFVCNSLLRLFRLKRFMQGVQMCISAIYTISFATYLCAEHKIY